MEKKTKKDMYVTIAQICSEQQDIVDFCNHEIELLEKKNKRSGGTRTMTPNQKENEEIKEQVRKVLKEEAQSINELLVAIDKDLTNQRMSAIMKQLVDSGEVIKEKIGKLTGYKKANPKDETEETGE